MYNPVTMNRPRTASQTSTFVVPREAGTTSLPVSFMKLGGSGEAMRASACWDGAESRWHLCVCVSTCGSTEKRVRTPRSPALRGSSCSSAASRTSSLPEQLLDHLGSELSTAPPASLSMTWFSRATSPWPQQPIPPHAPGACPATDPYEPAATLAHCARGWRDPLTSL